MKIDPKNIPKNFCILPWIHSAIEPNGKVKQCCSAMPWQHSLGQITESVRLKDIFNNDEYKQLRKELLAGKTPASCSKCDTLERITGNSYRIGSNSRFAHKISELDFDPNGSAEFIQTYIDYRFTNKCNHKCASCGPLYSSMHATDVKKQLTQTPGITLHKIEVAKNTFGISLTDESALDSITPLIELDTDIMVEEFKSFMPTVERIYFAGGEPLISDHHFEILDLFIESQQPVDLFYNTNFSELNYKNLNVVERWSKIKGSVTISASIDGIGDSAENYRVGFNTENYARNIQTVIAANHPNIELGFTFTFGVANVLKLVETLEWLEQFYTNLRHLNVNLNPIIAPTLLSLTSLNAEERIKISTELKNQLDAFTAKNINGRGKHWQEWVDRFVIKWLESNTFTELTTSNMSGEHAINQMLNQAGSEERFSELFPELFSTVYTRYKRQK